MQPRSDPGLRVHDSAHPGLSDVLPRRRVSPGCRPLVDHPQVAHALAYLTILTLTLLSGPTTRDLVASLQFAHGALRNQKRVLC